MTQTRADIIMRHRIHGPVVIGDAESTAKAITECLAAAQAEGAIPDDRPPPDPGSLVIWAGSLLRPRGIATFYAIDDARLWLDVLYVWPDKRGGGVASALIAAVEDYAQSVGIKAVLFGTSIKNAPMTACAARNGYAADHTVFRKRIDGGKRP